MPFLDRAPNLLGWLTCPTLPIKGLLPQGDWFLGSLPHLLHLHHHTCTHTKRVITLQQLQLKRPENLFLTIISVILKFYLYLLNTPQMHPLLSLQPFWINLSSSLSWTIIASASNCSPPCCLFNSSSFRHHHFKQKLSSMSRTKPATFIECTSHAKHSSKQLKFIDILNFIKSVFNRQGIQAPRD